MASTPKSTLDSSHTIHTSCIFSIKVWKMQIIPTLNLTKHMEYFRFTLERYRGISTRHTCPSCGRNRCFARYIDQEGEITFPDEVGRCDHEESCGYHLTPKAYFEQEPSALEQLSELSERRSYTPPPPRETCYMSREIMEQSLKLYESNHLFQFLSEKLGKESALSLMKLYRVGSSKHWPGATVFWQIDNDGRIRTGKIMLYNPMTGKRIKEPFNHISWAHSLLYNKDYCLKQCFFGEHLLREHTDKVVAIVESEKTALIAAHHLPQFVWIASGGKHGCLGSDALKVLQGRQVVLFPDTGATEYWQSKVPQMEALGIDVKIFNYLEQEANEEARQSGFDIADYLLLLPPKPSLLEEMIKRYPIIQTLIDRLQLKVIQSPFRDEKKPSQSYAKRGLRR